MGDLDRKAATPAVRTLELDRPILMLALRGVVGALDLSLSLLSADLRLPEDAPDSVDNPNKRRFVEDIAG